MLPIPSACPIVLGVPAKVVTTTVMYYYNSKKKKTRNPKVGSGRIGRKINDHGSWIGAGNKGSVFPEGVKVKMDSSAEGAGSLMEYEDTSETIKRQQEMGISKAKGHKQKSGYRN